MLNIEKIACSDLTSFVTYQNYAVTMLLINPIENDFAILFHVPMESETLGLFMAGPKSVTEMVHIS